MNTNTNTNNPFMVTDIFKLYSKCCAYVMYGCCVKPTATFNVSDWPFEGFPESSTVIFQIWQGSRHSRLPHRRAQ